MVLRTKLLQLLQEKPRTLEELAQLTNQSVLTIKWHLIGLPVREVKHKDSTLIFLNASNFRNFRNPSKEEIERICSICDKVEKEADGCPLKHHGFCKAIKVDNHDGDQPVNHDTTIKTNSTPSSSEINQSYHGLSYPKSQQNLPKKKRGKQNKNHSLPIEVDNSDHGWLTKPLTIPDFSILSGISSRQRRILQLLHQGKTQAQIARILKITRQAVHKHVKKFLKWDLIREKGSLHGDGKRRDIVYEVRHAVVNFLKLNRNMGCKLQNMGDDTSPQKPLFTLHRLQLAFHIVNQSKPFTETPSFVKTYSPRGWTGYVYQIGDVRIRALPRKVIAEFVDEQEPNESETAEQFLVRCIDKLKHAVELWLEELDYKGVELELSHPYIMNAPEFAFKSRMVKQYLKNLRLERVNQQLMQNGGIYNPINEPIADLWYDDSEDGEDYAHIETSSPDTATLVDKALENALSFPQIKEMIHNLHSRIEHLETLVNADLSQSQKFYRMFTFFITLLDRILALFGEVGRVEQNQNPNLDLVREILSAMNRIISDG